MQSWNLLFDPLMWSSSIEVLDIGAQHPLELPLTEDKQMIETLAPHTAEKAFTDRIRARGVIGGFEELDEARRRHSGETRSECAIVVVNEIFGGLPIGRSFSQLLRDPRVGGRARHIHMDHLSRLQEGVEERKKRTEEEGSRLEEITGPHVFCMIAEERFPGLSTGSLWANLPHILLNRSFTHSHIQLEKFPTDPLRSEDVGCVLPSP
jgi:hypothetical protein